MQGAGAGVGVGSKTTGDQLEGAGECGDAGRYLEVLERAALDGASRPMSNQSQAPAAAAARARVQCTAMTAMCKLAASDWALAPRVRRCLRQVAAQESEQWQGLTGYARRVIFNAFEPWFIDLNGILCRGEQYLPASSFCAFEPSCIELAGIL